jgi:hypothetical protein
MTFKLRHLPRSGDLSIFLFRFRGRALVMRVGSVANGSIDVLPINPRGEVIDSSGKHLLDADNPLWEGMSPVIVWPE